MKWNCAPSPGSLCIHIVAPIRAMNRAEMVRPSPVPPYLRVVELSPWEKGSKMELCFSCGIPIPVSETVK